MFHHFAVYTRDGCALFSTEPPAGLQHGFRACRPAAAISRCSNLDATGWGWDRISCALELELERAHSASPSPRCAARPEEWCWWWAARRNLRPGRFVRHVPVAIAIKSGHVPPHSLCPPDLHPTTHQRVPLICGQPHGNHTSGRFADNT